jgi:tetratricopeptide (TPR) repeat protein
MSDCLDALNYALSYEPEDADSLCLMGRVYSEVLRDYETAKKYFEEAMQSNISNVNTLLY